MANILVVDDNLTVCKLAQRVLEKAGHNVSVAPSGREALGMIQDGLPVDVLLLDHSLPDMQGDGLLAGLPLENRRRIRVLLSTGYDSRQLARNYPEDIPLHSLQKPWDVADLLQAVSALLSDRHDSG